MVRALLGVGVSLAIWLVAAPGSAQQGQPDPSQVRAQVRDVMSRPEFSYSPSIMERIGRWISDFLDRLFGSSAGPSGTFGGGIGPFIAFLMILAAVVAVVGVVVYAVRHRLRRSVVEATPSTIEIEHRRRASDWGREAADFEAAGRWKEALRARYRELVRILIDRNQLPDVPGRTTGELRSDLAVSTPAASRAFDSASLAFELAWYADLPTGAEDNARFRRSAGEVLAAAPRTGHHSDRQDADGQDADRQDGDRQDASGDSIDGERVVPTTVDR